MRSTLVWLLLFALTQGAAQPVDEPVESSVPTPITVGIKEAPPFIIGGEPYTGISIDLWSELAQRLELEYTLEARDLEGLLRGSEDKSQAKPSGLASPEKDRVAEKLQHP